MRTVASLLHSQLLYGGGQKPGRTGLDSVPFVAGTTDGAGPNPGEPARHHPQSQTTGAVVACVGIRPLAAALSTGQPGADVFQA